VFSVRQRTVYSHPKIGWVALMPKAQAIQITQYVAWMERQFNACQTPRSVYSSIFNSFQVIRTASTKNSHFHVPQPTFLFPLGTPLGQSAVSQVMTHRW